MDSKNTFLQWGNYRLVARYVRADSPAKLQELFDKQMAEVKAEEEQNAKNFDELCKYFAILGGFIIFWFSIMIATGWR